MTKSNKTEETPVSVASASGPTEEQILAEMRQQEKRKQYQKSAKAVENRQKYMKKHYGDIKANRDAIKSLKVSDPEKYAALMAKVQADIAAGVK